MSPRFVAPALLTSRSSRPKRAMAAITAAPGASGCRRSAAWTTDGVGRPAATPASRSAGRAGGAPTHQIGRAGDEGDGHALGGQRLGDGPADTATGPGDEGDLAGEV